MIPTQEDDALVLFAGCGGSTIGIHEAGLRSTGVEYWPTAARTHRDQVGPCLIIDLSDATQDHLLDPWRGCKVLWGSPPCQPFSSGGDGLGADDTRDGLPWMMRIVERLLPDVVFMENVRGLTFEKHAHHLAYVRRCMEANGYRLDFRVLNAADYGVPQTRQRLFMIARRDGGPIVWPMVTHTEEPGLFTDRWVSMADGLGWEMTSRPFGTIANAHTSGGPDMIGVGGSGAREAIYRERAEGRWVLQPWWGASDRHPDRELDEPAPTVVVNARDWAWRLNTHVGADEDGNTQVRSLDQPAPTVATKSESQWTLERPATTICGDQRVFHPGGHTANDGRDNTRTKGRSEDTIRLTIGELAALQDFPDGFTFHGSKGDQARQIGNAVPRRLARLLVEANLERPAP